MIRILYFLAIVLALGVTIPNVRAGDPAVAFEQANKLYEEGKYADAAAAYSKLLAAGDVSEPLYFNNGNALFKMGQIGRAIASYRQAQQLSPRDPELRANLQFARTRARGGSPYQADRWRGWMTVLSVNEWTVLTAGTVWLLFILLALGQWRPELKRTLRSYVMATGVMVVALAVCFGIVLNFNILAQSAIVVVGEAEVRNGPLDESPAIYKVRDGVELNVVDEKDGWLQVVDSADRAGWLRRDQVLVFEPLLPQKSKS
jgi:tetratricopeptide (TPR) repeat protein